MKAFQDVVSLLLLRALRNWCASTGGLEANVADGAIVRSVSFDGFARPTK